MNLKENTQNEEMKLSFQFFQRLSQEIDWDNVQKIRSHQQLNNNNKNSPTQSTTCQSLKNFDFVECKRCYGSGSFEISILWMIKQKKCQCGGITQICSYCQGKGQLAKGRRCKNCGGRSRFSY